MLLEGCCDCGFAAGAESCEPDGEATLLAELTTLFARESWMPCNVSGAVVAGELLFIGEEWYLASVTDTHVAMMILASILTQPFHSEPRPVYCSLKADKKD